MVIFHPLFENLGHGDLGYNAIKNKGGVLFFIDWIDCIYAL
jgi:hypothetical protein